MALALASTLDSASHDFAIGICHGLFGTHLGAIYLGDDDQWVVLHLSFHKQLKIDPIHNDWAICIPAMPKHLIDQIGALLPLIADKYAGDKNGGIDYGINLLLGKDAISAAGEYSIPENADGLTCASFIAAIFAALKVPLVQLDTWKDSPINKIWGEAVACALQVFGATSEHVKKVRESNAGHRLRPEEVVAAAEQRSQGLGATFDSVQARTSAIGKELGQLIKAPEPIQKTSPYYPCVEMYKNGMASEGEKTSQETDPRVGSEASHSSAATVLDVVGTAPKV